MDSTKAATTTRGIASVFEVISALAPMSGYESVEASELGGVFGATRQHRFDPPSRRDTHCHRMAGRPRGSLQVTGTTRPANPVSRSP